MCQRLVKHRDCRVDDCLKSTWVHPAQLACPSSLVGVEWCHQRDHSSSSSSCSGRCRPSMMTRRGSRSSTGGRDTASFCTTATAAGSRCVLGRPCSSPGYCQWFYSQSVSLLACSCRVSATASGVESWSVTLYSVNSTHLMACSFVILGMGSRLNVSDRRIPIYQQG